MDPRRRSIVYISHLQWLRTIGIGSTQLRCPSVSRFGECKAEGVARGAATASRVPESAARHLGVVRARHRPRVRKLCEVHRRRAHVESTSTHSGDNQQCPERLHRDNYYLAISSCRCCRTACSNAGYCESNLRRHEALYEMFSRYACLRWFAFEF